MLSAIVTISIIFIVIGSYLSVFCLLISSGVFCVVLLYWCFSMNLLTERKKEIIYGDFFLCYTCVLPFIITCQWFALVLLLVVENYASIIIDMMVGVADCGD